MILPTKRFISILIFLPLLSSGLLVFAANTSLEFPKLSIESLGDASKAFPLRTQRLQALEHDIPSNDWHQLDELDQDLLFLREKRWGHRPLIHPLPPSLPAAVAAQAVGKPTGKTVIFFDMNFAPTEIMAARQAALARGDEFLLIPKRTELQQNQIEKEYRKVLAKKEQLKRCLDKAQKSCEALEIEINKGIERLHQELKLIQRVEDIRSVWSQIEERRIQPTTIIFSGHSGVGAGFIGGFFGMLSAGEIQSSLQSHPQLLSSIKSIFLWGCYTGTLSAFTETWQKKLPTVRAFAGYRNRAPLGIRPSSGRLLKSFLLKEQELLATTDLSKLQDTFRTLDLAGDLDATVLLGDIYISYDRAAKVADLIRSCKAFDPRLLEQFTCYNEAQPGCENPPHDHGGPLRELYSYLQINRHCDDILLAKYPDIPHPGVVLRLIFIDSIKDNFSRHHGAHFQT